MTCPECQAGEHNKCPKAVPSIPVPESEPEQILLEAIFGEPVKVCCCE